MGLFRREILHPNFPLFKRGKKRSKGRERHFLHFFRSQAVMVLENGHLKRSAFPSSDRFFHRFRCLQYLCCLPFLQLKFLKRTWQSVIMQVFAKQKHNHFFQPNLVNMPISCFFVTCVFFFSFMTFRVTNVRINFNTTASRHRFLCSAFWKTPQKPEVSMAADICHHFRFVFARLAWCLFGPWLSMADDKDPKDACPCLCGYTVYIRN